MQSPAVRHDRYRFLDEMRGMAALIVLAFHVSTRASAPPIAPNGYLAVDFFFMLSGFVIAEAYRDRFLNGMTLGNFTARRLVRMMPIVVLGVCLGTTYALARWAAAPSRSDDLPGVLTTALLNLFLIPKWWHGAATGWEVFPVNGPLWSLFFELIINFAWAALLVSRRTFALAALIAASLLILIAMAGFYGTMDMGWNLPTLPGGLARVCFGFLTGVAIHANRHRLPRLGRPAAFAALLLLVLGLCAPFTGLWWTLPVTLIALPLTLMLAVSAGGQSLIPGGQFLGATSYPVYGLHVPVLAFYSGAFEKLTGSSHTGFEAYLLIPAIYLLAAGAMLYFEAPAQRILRRALEARKPPAVLAGER